MEKLPIHEEAGEKNSRTSRRNFLKLGLKATVGTLIATEVAGEQKEQPAKHIEYEVVSFSGSEAHKSGNDFANKVGGVLQENLKNGQPSKVINPTVKISVKNINGKAEFKFSWHCDIKSCEAKDADQHFDRRGTLLSGRTLEEAKQKVEAELRSSDKVNKMMRGFDRTYGGHKMPYSFVSESSSQEADGTWWYIKEFFCTAK
jgi:hypothetical protein